MLPVWSIAVDGVVRGLSRSGDGVLVELEDGDAYRLDGRSGASVAVGGLDLAWHARGDVIAGDAAGEPVPPAHMPVPPPVKKLPVPTRDSPENPPPIATPWQVPPPGPAAWQLALFELSGGLRARNDYAIDAAVIGALRGAAGSPLVVTYGPGHHDALVLDATHGDPLRRVELPDELAPAALFSTVVAGKPVAGAVLAKPLRIVVF
jgi:hypothetical protein